MIEIKVLSDIKEYKTTILFNLTLKQLIAVLASGTLSIITYNLLKNIIQKDIIIVLCMFLYGIPAFFLSMFQINNVDFSKIFKSVIATTILAPKTRVYATENTHKQMIEELNLSEEKKKKKKKYKKSRKAIK